MSESEKLKHLRGILKLSQTDFSESVGMKQGLYSKIERGESQLTNEVAGNIISLYNVNPNWWFFGKEPVFMTDKGEGYDAKEREEWREKYMRVLEENASLYKKLYKEQVAGQHAERKSTEAIERIKNT